MTSLKLGGRQQALRRRRGRAGTLTLDAGPGEIVALLGPSGAGKSTTLRVAAGIDKPSDGRVLVDDADVTKAHSWKRNAAMVFESYVLYPQLSVFDNIAFPLRAPAMHGPLRRRRDPPPRRARREDASRSTGCSSAVRPSCRAASASASRSLARSSATPSVFLLDEPIAHLDAKLRHWLRGELRRRLTATDVPTIWATPDGLEAMAVADRIALHHRRARRPARHAARGLQLAGDRRRGTAARRPG